MTTTCEPMVEADRQPLEVKPNPTKPTLETLLLAIRRDSQVEADRYIEEVRVPFGGE